MPSIYTHQTENPLKTPQNNKTYTIMQVCKPFQTEHYPLMKPYLRTCGSLTMRTTDHSDQKRFSFSFFCDRCGKEWISQPVPYTAGGFTAVDHEETRQLLWEQERRAAFDGANLEAHFHFNNCPKCGKWVCDDCFGVEEMEHGGVCKDCC